MTIHIIHLHHRKDRLAILLDELRRQNITDYIIVDGVEDNEYPWRGIAKAHKSIVRHAKESNYPCVLIAEDDIQFSNVGAFEYYINNTPDEFDLYLGGIVYGKINENEVSDFSGLTLYTIHNRFYDFFLNVSDNGHIDRNLSGNGTFKVCTPMIVRQYSGYSDNRKCFVNYESFFEGKAFF